MKILFTREWAWPNHNTFEIPPIRHFVNKYIKDSKISVDPFARNSQICTYTNDLNPKTKAQYHLSAKEFLETMQNNGIKSDMIIFDPPYSLRQVKECYESVGNDFTQKDSQTAIHWNDEKKIANDILKIGGVVLTFGWNSVGMGRKRGYQIEEILLVCHGGAHNDTICIAERKFQEQSEMFQES